MHIVHRPPLPKPQPVVRVERLSPDDWRRLRTVRLRALQASPDAFGGTFEEATARSPENWAEQVSAMPTFVAVTGAGDDVGMVRCAPDGAGTVWLLSLWVAPEIRRRGVGTALIDAGIRDARSADMKRIALAVAEHNAAAIALYIRKGFTRTGDAAAPMSPPREHVRELLMELRLA